MKRAHECEPPDLDALVKLCRQFIEEEFSSTPQTSHIVLKRSTFVLEDPHAVAAAGEEIEEEEGEMASRLFVPKKQEVPASDTPTQQEEEEEDKPEEKGAVEGKKAGNPDRLVRFFGETPEEGVQYAPQPANVKLVKLKRIFGEAVEPSHAVIESQVREYNKQYRDSLNEGLLPILYIFKCLNLT